MPQVGQRICKLGGAAGMFAGERMMDQELLHIGPRLRSLRRKKRLSQQQVADLSSIGKAMVSKIETGRVIPTLPVLFRFLRAVDCSAEEFFQGVDNRSTPRYVHRTAASSEPLERELASLGFQYYELLEGVGTNFAARAVILEIEPDSRREKVTTDAFEYKYVLCGELDYEIGEETIKLRPGDSLFYDGRIPHVPHNRGREMARMLVLYIHDQL